MLRILVLWDLAEGLVGVRIAKHALRHLRVAGVGEEASAASIVRRADGGGRMRLRGVVDIWISALHVCGCHESSRVLRNQERSLTGTRVRAGVEVYHRRTSRAEGRLGATRALCALRAEGDVSPSLQRQASVRDLGSALDRLMSRRCARRLWRPGVLLRLMYNTDRGMLRPRPLIRPFDRMSCK